MSILDDLKVGLPVRKRRLDVLNSSSGQLIQVPCVWNSFPGSISLVTLQAVTMYVILYVKKGLGYFAEKMKNHLNGNFSGDENDVFLRDSYQSPKKFISKAEDDQSQRREVASPFLVLSVVANIVFISFLGIYLHETLRRDLEDSRIKCPRNAFIYFTYEDDARVGLQKQAVSRSTLDLLILVWSVRIQQSREGPNFPKVKLLHTKESYLTEDDLQYNKRDSGIHIHSSELNSTKTIKESGFYLTYSHVTLKSFDQDTKVFHRLNRKRRKSEENSHSKTHTTVLMSKLNSLERDRMVFHTSTLMDVVYLHKDDIVYPSVDQTSSIYKMTDANYWGFTKL